MILEEIYGNIFDSPSYFTLCHCISRDLRMSRGIALDFKLMFGGIRQMRSQNPTVGDIVYTVDGSRHIVGLVTKRFIFNYIQIHLH